MSIAVEIYADHANRVKDDWADRLQEAVNNRNWDDVKRIAREIRDYQFQE